MATEQDSTVIEDTEEVPEESAIKPAEKPAGGGNVQTVSSRALAQIRKDAAARGRREAQQSADREARNAGFGNHAEMVEAARRARRGGGNKAETKTEERTDAKAQASVAALQGEVSNLREANKRLLQRIARLSKEAKRAIKSKHKTEAEMELRVLATRHGVQDVDYAVHMLQRKLENSSLDEQKAFDENVWFSKDLKKTHPHLYKVGVAPASTTPAVKEPAAAPKPGAVEQKEADKVEDVKDARTVPADQYQAMLKRLGLKDPASASF